MSRHGSFAWYELMAPDLDAAQAFYGAVLGWSAEDAGMPGTDYRLLRRHGENVAGLMAPMPGGPKGWMGYVAVDDVDGATASARADGAHVHREPTDIAGVGRFAILADAQGALLALLQPLPPAQEPRDTLEEIGRCGWHELHARELGGAWRFYERLCRWEKGETHDMGSAGTYQLFRRAGDARDMGGMVGGASDPHWLYYWNVAAIDTAAEQVRDGGGAIEHEPHQVPGGSWILMCRDPQGARFALSAKER